MKTTVNKSGIVKLMRTIRDKFSIEINKMSLEEEKQYLKQQLKKLKLKRKDYNKT